MCAPMQGGVPTLGDIYDIVLETEKGTHERLQIFDTPGSVKGLHFTNTITIHTHNRCLPLMT